MSRSMNGWHVLITIPNETSWISFKTYSFLDAGERKRTSVNTGKMGSFLKISCSSFSDKMIFSINSIDFPNGPLKLKHQSQLFYFTYLDFHLWLLTQTNTASLRLHHMNSPEFVSHLLMTWCKYVSISGSSCNSSTKSSGWTLEIVS